MNPSVSKPSIARLCAITGIVLATTLSASADSGGTWSSGSWTPDLGDASANPTALDGAVRAYYNTGDGQCYAGGRFSQPYNNIAFWDGSSWQDTGSTFWSGDSSANAFTEYEGHVYAAGRFVNSQGAVCLLVRLEEEMGFPGLWRWAPVHHASSSAPESEAFALAVHDGNLVMGGSFRDQNGKTNLVAYNGSEFMVLGEDTANGPVYALASRESSTHAPKLFAGGSFTNIGSMIPGIGGGPAINTERNLAVYQSGQWSQALGPADDTVYALHDVSMGMQKTLYIGGRFDEIDGVSGLQGIARHTGSNINRLSGGTGGTVHAIQAWSGGLAVGGEFTIDIDANDTAFNIASWSPTGDWSSLDDGVEGSVFDGETGAPVLALCRYNEERRRGVYAGGNFRTCGADLDTFTNHAARFAQVFESNANYEDDWVAESNNVAFEELPPFSLLLSPFDPGQEGRLNWGVEHASNQRIGFGVLELPVEAPIDFTTGWETNEPIDPVINFSIYRPTTSGPFLPDPSVIEFPAFDLSAGMFHDVKFEAVNEAGQVLDLEKLATPASTGAVFEFLGNVRSITSANGHGAYDDRYLVIEFTAPSMVFYRNPAAPHDDFDQLLHNVTRIQMVGSEAMEFNQRWSNNIEMAFTEPLLIDRLDSGFGYFGNRHSLTSGDLGITIGTGDLPTYDLSSESAGSLEISGAEDHTAETYGDAAYERMGMSFEILDAEIDSSLRIEARGGIRVGNPADLPEEDETSFTITRSDFSNAHIMHEPMTVLQNQPTRIQLLRDGEVVRDYTSGANGLSLEVINAFDGQVFDASVDFTRDSSMVQWTDPRLVVLHDPFFGDEIIEVDINGWRLKNPAEESDPDGDGIADQIKPVSLKVDMNQFMNVRVFDERFDPIESQPETNPADFNGDGIVDGSDLGHILSEWGQSPGSTADLNGDGMVDGSDLGMFLSYWI